MAEKIQEKGEGKKVKKSRHPDKPKFPLSAFFRFNNASIDKIKS